MRQRARSRQLTAAELIGDPLIAAIARLVSAQPDGTWCGSYADALAELCARTAEATRADPTFWPRNTQALGRRLGLMGDGLRAAGIVLNTRRGGICFARAAARTAA